jgi:hypothetical protein
MMRNLWRIVALMLAGSGLAAGAGAGLRVEQSTLDLGTVQAGTDAVGVFVFHNDGDGPVKIIRAKPS